MESSTPKAIELAITVKKEDLICGVWQIVSKLRAQWSEDKIEYKIFSDGITNKLVGVIHANDKNNMILVRVFGENTEKIIDRDIELKNMKILHSLGFGPILYASFSNGLAYQYLPGETLTVKSCLDENIYPLVAEKMAHFHRQFENVKKHLCNEGGHSTMQSFLWRKLKRFIELLPEKYQSNIPSKDELIEELSWLEEMLCQLNDELVFCHNDLLLGNILYDEIEHSIEFIDFEYAGANYQSYDIANHFCEFAGVDDFNSSRYPDEDFRRKWITIYLKSFYQDQNVDSKKVQLLLEHVEFFTLASNFFWGVWSIIQAENSSIDFDFTKYSILRLGEYYKKKRLIGKISH